ncbi:MAG: hypothetical protein BWX47_01123 [candidate division Hyd24-12 bacterium ADurb.Bin004]|nr:MAG: hypothetical protein BWX47_01123 [candidate division Hyd24-12 bacterium ADurb.Bin004]
MSRCSRVWGITPSSAATTSRKKSTVATPATICLTNLSWPGTSMKARTPPSGRGMKT